MEQRPLVDSLGEQSNDVVGLSTAISAVSVPILLQKSPKKKAAVGAEL